MILLRIKQLTLSRLIHKLQRRLVVAWPVRIPQIHTSLQHLQWEVVDVAGDGLVETFPLRCGDDRVGGLREFGDFALGRLRGGVANVEDEGWGSVHAAHGCHGCSFINSTKVVLVDAQKPSVIMAMSSSAKRVVAGFCGIGP